jgi:hypothetical protein
MTNLSFSYQLTHLFSLLSKETELNYYDRILMYKDLLEHTLDAELKDLHTSVLENLHSYYKEIVFRNNDHELNTIYNLLGRRIPKMGKTLYFNPENVHVFSKEATEIALKIIKQYPQKYRRPRNSVFNSTTMCSYFDLIESDRPYNGIELTDLFASIWEYIGKHQLYDFFLRRLLQEIEDSVNVCLSGRFVRLVNVINGVDDDFVFSVSKQEYHQSYIFHLLNKHVNILDLENFEQNVEQCINTNADLVKTTRSNDIQKEEVIRILQNYTKSEWEYSPMTYYTPVAKRRL